MSEVDWESLFVPSGSLVEIVIRGTVVYLALFLAMRYMPRRTVGATSPSDLLVIVLIADAVQQGMAGEYKSITEALMLAFVIFGWATLVDWLDARYPNLHLAEAPPMQIVANGRFLRRNMKRQNLTEDEVMAAIRQHGQDSLKKVSSALLEGDGRISIILDDGEETDEEGKKPGA